MQYFGGKQRIVKHIAPILSSAASQRGCYVEPFVGGASVISSVTSPRRLASDANKALITMWESLAKGWSPPEVVSEEEYRALKSLKDPLDPMTAFAGFGCSFAGKWFGGYAGNGARNYAANAASSLRKKMKGLNGVEWSSGDYQDADYPDGCVIYCDPPYQGTTQYAGAPNAFNWEEFWEFCRWKSDWGHAVFISEYLAPPDFLPVFEIESRLDIRTKDAADMKRTEKLFMHKNDEYISTFENVSKAALTEKVQHIHVP